MTNQVRSPDPQDPTQPQPDVPDQPKDQPTDQPTPAVELPKPEEEVAMATKELVGDRPKREPKPKCAGCGLTKANCICAPPEPVKSKTQKPKCQVCTLVKCVCKKAAVADSLADFVTAVRKSVEREEPRPKPAPKGAEPQDSHSPVPDTLESDSWSMSESELEDSKVEGFGSEGCVSAEHAQFPQFWDAHASRLQNPELWVQTLFVDGKLDATRYRVWCEAMDRYWGRQPNPTQTSHVLTNSLLRNLSQWVFTLEPKHMSQAKMDAATENVDQLFIQRAFRTAKNRRNAEKLKERLQGASNTKRYAALYDAFLKDEAKESQKKYDKKDPKKEIKKPDDKKDKK